MNIFLQKPEAKVNLHPRASVTRFRANPLATASAVVLTALPALHAWTPGTGSPDATAGFSVNLSDRTDVLAFHNTVYKASEFYPANLSWTGNVSICEAGTTGAAFKNDVLRRVNYYRALGGLPADISFTAAKNASAQSAALMMAAQGSLSHTPSGFACYTATGYTAAGTSNLALGSYGPRAIDQYMVDAGANNAPVGHRRWILYSRGQSMGTGDIPATSGKFAANALWVIGDLKAAQTLQYVAWPNRGFTPHPLVPQRWSLSYPGAVFSAATVTMSRAGVNVPVTIDDRTSVGMADNTIVWVPSNLPTSLTADVTYNITVSGISGINVPTSHSYSVTLFNPDVLGQTAVVSGSATPSTSGQAYTFTPVNQSDAYQLRVSSASSATWIEGAEDATSSFVQSGTTGTYPLRQTTVKRTGAKAFQLAFPGFDDQSFVVTRDVIPSATSSLLFYDLGRFATTTSTLSAEISSDSGSSWTSVWSRNGVGLNSGLWNPDFISRSLSLSAYAGKLIQIRFILRLNNASISIGTSSSHGFFIDDISVSNATQLTDTKATTLAAAATGFSLDATTAGNPLVAGKSYVMRVRPNVGTRWFGDGPLFTATATAPVAASGYAAWAALYPTLTGGFEDAPLGDGVPNGLKYAFGLNPLIHASANALPQPIKAGNTYTVSYPVPVGVSGVSYGMEWSSDLMTWRPLTNTGSGSTRTFSLITATTPVFTRHRVTREP